MSDRPFGRMMNSLPLYLVLLAAAVGLFAFLILQPRSKVLIAFLVLSSLFDLVPTIVYGFYLRDPGLILMLIAWLQLLTRRRVTKVHPVMFVRAVKGLLVWSVLCVAYGILVNHYPVLLTLKAARQLILGYCSFFVFVRLYETDPGSFQFLVKWLYRITLTLMPIVLVQYISGVQLFFGLIREYGGAVRALPIFLPICLLFMWHMCCRLVAGHRVAWHERLYIGLTVVIIGLTYTRGIYLASIAILIAVIIVVGGSGRLLVNRTLTYLGLGTVCLLVLLATGSIDRVVNRFLSGVGVISGSGAVVKTYVDDVDTLTGRLELLGERIDLVWSRNPFMGFAFIHETLVPKDVRSGLKYGSPVSTPEYEKMYARGMPYVVALHSADIGWGDVVVDTGLIGLLLLAVIIGAVTQRQFTAVMSRRLNDADYFWATALFLQIVMLTLLMFNGNPFVNNVHIVCFLLASFAYCSSVTSIEQGSLVSVRRVLRA